MEKKIYMIKGIMIVSLFVLALTLASIFINGFFRFFFILVDLFFLAIFINTLTNYIEFKDDRIIVRQYVYSSIRKYTGNRTHTLMIEDISEIHLKKSQAIVIKLKDDNVIYFQVDFYLNQKLLAECVDDINRRINQTIQ